MFKICQNKNEWDDYIIEHGGHPLQLWGWGDVKSAHGWGAHRLFFDNHDQQPSGAVQVLIRKLPWPLRSIAYVPRGPVTDNSNREVLLDELAKYIKHTYHSVVVSIEPDNVEYSTPKGWIKSVNHILPAHTIVLDLNQNESKLLNDMSKKTRQYIRKSASEAIDVRLIQDKKELGKCLDIYHATAKRAKFDMHKDQYYYDVFDRLGDHSLVFAAYFDDQPIAFLWLAISADTAFELYGGMNEFGQQLRANYMLKWHAIRKCKEWGLARYDFGGLLEGGVTTFKAGWADRETELAGTFDKPLSIFYGIWTRGLPMAKSIIRRLKSIFKR